MKSKYKAYAGIGSRGTPVDVQKYMEGIAILLAKQGYTLRSGGAEGADTAFETGCDIANGDKEIYLPWRLFNNNESLLIPDVLDKWNEAKIISMRFHPYWDKLSKEGEAFHTRNVFQVLGDDLKTPVEFVVCYTVCGGISGGTGQALRIAKHYNIPIINLFHTGVLQ